MTEVAVTRADLEVRSQPDGTSQYTLPAQVDQLRNALGENAVLQAQLNQAVARRLFEVEKTAHEARALAADRQPVVAARPASTPGATDGHRSAEAAALAQLTKVVVENAASQMQVNRALVSSLEAFGNSLHGLDKLVREMNSRIEGLTAGNLAWGRLAAPVGNDLLLTKVLNRFLMYVETTDMSVTPHLVADGCWERCITEAFAGRLKPGMIVVDVGANYGYYTLLAAGHVGTEGRVYAFEPSPRTFELLKRNIQVNWFGSIVHAYQLAALDSRKRIEFHIPRQFQGCSSLFVQEQVPEADPWPNQPLIVDTVPLDEVISKPVDLMKIDAEGSEPLVFEGMQEIIEGSPNLTIFMEFNIALLRQSAEPRSFLSRVRQLGFSLQWFTPWDTLEPFEEEKALEFPLFNLLLERK